MPIAFLKRAVLIAGFVSANLAGAVKLDPLHLDGAWIRDSNNRVIVLRGAVTITRNNDGKPMMMTAGDYDRIAGWGFNVQQIRLEGCRLGLLPPCKADPAYFELLDSWVNLGEERGIYTIFKVTTYDVPGLDFQTQFKKGAWDKLWDAESGWQDQFIGAWAKLWEHFKGRKAVIGYDLLNECFQGSNTKGFVHNYLFPFYRKAHAVLEKIDSEHAFIFQPPLTTDDSLEPLGGRNILFAPHYYPHGPDPEQQYRDILGWGKKVEAPMLIGEYGLPNTPLGIPGVQIKAGAPGRDKGDALLFDQSNMGTIKTWYTSVGNWSLLTPEQAEHPRLQYFSRPYPQRTAGIPRGFSFDFDKHEWSYTWDADPAAKGDTLIFVAGRRHYPGGFKITTDAREYHFDTASEILTASGGHSVGITPKQ